MISHGIALSQSGTIPSQDQRVVDFCRAAARPLYASAAGEVSPCKVPGEFGMLWGDVLTLEFDGPQPAAVATLARLAHEHGLVLFELPAHRVLTPADITTTFGEPMIPAAAPASPFELVTRCRKRWECVDDLRVLGTDLWNCTLPVDPTYVTPIHQEREAFEQVLDLLGCYDLEELRERLDDLSERLEELIYATADDSVR